MKLLRITPLSENIVYCDMSEEQQQYYNEEKNNCGKFVGKPIDWISKK
jgi:SNF2 family DNA or RNA helicase